MELTSRREAECAAAIWKEVIHRPKYPTYGTGSLYVPPPTPPSTGFYPVNSDATEGFSVPESPN